MTTTVSTKDPASEKSKLSVKCEKMEGGVKIELEMSTATITSPSQQQQEEEQEQQEGIYKIFTYK